MRRVLVLVPLLVGCGSSADVSGTALGITWDKTRHVFFGGPYIAISNIEVDCEQLAFVRANYELGQSPTTDEMQLLQFVWAAGEVDEGKKSIGIGASVSAAIVKIVGDSFDFAYAEGGVIDVESVSTEHVSGTFDGVAFEDGSVDGSFDAEWCRNLKER